MTAPDFIEPFVGWRMWRWASAGRGGDPHGNLHSPSRGTVWKPRQRLEAECPHPDRPVSVAPHKLSSGSQHHCGIYAARTLPDLFERSNLSCGDNLIYGLVALWGKVIVGAYGFRAQYAYPQAFYVPDAAANGPFAVERFPMDVLPEWGVPVFRVETADEIQGAAPKAR